MRHVRAERFGGRQSIAPRVGIQLLVMHFGLLDSLDSSSDPAPASALFIQSLSSLRVSTCQLIKLKSISAFSFANKIQLFLQNELELIRARLIQLSRVQHLHYAYSAAEEWCGRLEVALVSVHCSFIVHQQLNVENEHGDNLSLLERKRMVALSSSRGK